MSGQMSIFDYMESVKPKPIIGKWLSEITGRQLRYEELTGMIGQAVAFDHHNAGFHWSIVALLKQLDPDGIVFWKSEDGRYRGKIRKDRYFFPEDEEKGEPGNFDTCFELEEL